MNMTLNNRFADLLAKKGTKEGKEISIPYVEKITGIPRKTLYVWYRNEVTRFDADVVEKLCKYLEVNPGDLLEIE